MKYFLFEYENFLRRKRNESAIKIGFDDFKNIEIEHILPLEFKENWSETIGNFLKDLKENKKIEQAEKVLINSLGNLTLLKTAENSKLNNEGWTKKKEEYGRRESYNGIEISDNDFWSPEEIAKRGERMLRFLESKVDGLSFSDQDIKEALFCEDYIIELVYENSSTSNS